jgi:hypothetical protein
LAGIRQNGTAHAANAGIYHHHVDGVLGEIMVGLRDGDGAIKNVKRLDGIGDIHDSCRWVDAMYYPLHCSHVVFRKAEVSGKGNDSLRWQIVGSPKVLGCDAAKVSCSSALSQANVSETASLGMNHVAER